MHLRGRVHFLFCYYNFHWQLGGSVVFHTKHWISTMWACGRPEKCKLLICKGKGRVWRLLSNEYRGTQRSSSGVCRTWVSVTLILSYISFYGKNSVIAGMYIYTPSRSWRSLHYNKIFFTYFFTFIYAVFNSFMGYF